MHENDCLSQTDLFWFAVLKYEKTQTEFYIIQMLSVFRKGWSAKEIYIVCEFMIVSAREPDAWQRSKRGIDLVYSKAVGRERIRRA
jgi:hypothetical protein